MNFIKKSLVVFLILWGSISAAFADLKSLLSSYTRLENEHALLLGLTSTARVAHLSALELASHSHQSNQEPGISLAFQETQIRTHLVKSLGQELEKAVPIFKSEYAQNNIHSLICIIQSIQSLEKEKHGIDFWKNQNRQISSLLAGVLKSIEKLDEITSSALAKKRSRLLEFLETAIQEKANLFEPEVLLKLKDLQNQIQLSENSIEFLHLQIKELEATLQSKTSEISELEKTAEKMKDEISEAQKQKDTLSQQIVQLNQTFAEKQKEFHQIYETTLEQIRAKNSGRTDISFQGKEVFPDSKMFDQFYEGMYAHVFNELAIEPGAASQVVPESITLQPNITFQVLIRNITELEPKKGGFFSKEVPKESIEKVFKIEMVLYAKVSTLVYAGDTPKFRAYAVLNSAGRIKDEPTQMVFTISHLLKNEIPQLIDRAIHFEKSHAEQLQQARYQSIQACELNSSVFSPGSEPSAPPALHDDTNEGV